MENKRIWAMVGVVYMVYSVFLMTYWIATTSLLTGLTGLLTFPLCGGMAVQSFNNRWKVRHGRMAGNQTAYLVLGVLFTLAACLTLVLGIQELLAKF